jgi:hypothetical protein
MVLYCIYSSGMQRRFHNCLSYVVSNIIKSMTVGNTLPTSGGRSIGIVRPEFMTDGVERVTEQAALGLDQRIHGVTE